MCKFIRCICFCCYILAVITKPSLPSFQDYPPPGSICCLHNCSFTLFPSIIRSTLMRTGYLAETLTDLVTEAIRCRRYPFWCITYYLPFTFSPLFLRPIYVFLMFLLPNNDQYQCLLVCCRLWQLVTSTCTVSISMWPVSFHESPSAVHHQVPPWILSCLNTVLPTIVLWDWAARINLSPLPTGTEWGPFFPTAGQ